jgi:hypothetical protein
MSFTLQIANGAPQLFSTSGLSRLKRQIRSQRAGSFSFTADGASCDGNALANEGTLCTVYTDGAPFFSGRLHQIPRKGSGAGEKIDYQLLDAWQDFERIVYQQQWNVLVVLSEGGAPTLAAEYRSECILGMDLSGDALNSGQVITQIVNWAIGVGANCQLGTIGVSAPVPFDEIKDLPCSECIKKMLRLTPDAVTWLDYSTTPPTFNITRRGACEAVNIPFVGSVESVNIRALPDLLAPSVVIRYLQENQIDGQPSVNVIPDVYPPGATGLEYGALVQTTRLAGSNAAYQKQPVVTTPLPADETDSNAVPFLQRFTPWLKQFSPDRIQVNILTPSVDPGQTDASGNPVDSDISDYPNVVISGDIAPWMGVQAARCTVVASISYIYPDSPDDESEKAYLIFGPDGGSLANYNNRVILTVGVVGTDAVTQTYAQLASYTEGEGVPTGLAEEIYSSLATLQYEGAYTIIGSEAGYWSLGTVLNMTGGRTEWTSMNALLQEIEDDLDNGQTTLKFGAAGHLTLRDLMEQLRGNRTRATSRHIHERQTGQPGDAPTVNGPGHGSDTNNAPPPAPTVIPWVDFIEQQDNADSSPATWDGLLGYGQSSFADTDEIDHTGPLEALEISVGNDGSAWPGPDDGYGAESLYNGLSIISGDSTAINDQLLIGRTDSDGNGGSCIITPYEPSLDLSPNLDGSIGEGDQYITLDLPSQIIHLEDGSGDYVELSVDTESGAPEIDIVNAQTSASTIIDENSITTTAGSGDDGTIVFTGGDGASFTLDTGDLDGKAAYFQEVQVCVGGATMNAYILMTDPF